MDNHFLQGNCLPLEFSSLPWGGDCSPNQEGGGEGGGKLALGQSGMTGGGGFSVSGPPGSFPRVHSSLTCQLRGTPSPGVSFRKGVQETHFWSGVPLSCLLWVSCFPGSPMCLHGGGLSFVSCSHRNKDDCQSWCSYLLGARLWAGHLPF